MRHKNLTGDAKMKRITIIFKTHLDIGFTSLAEDVRRCYRDYIRAAVSTACHFRAKDRSPNGFRYRWTVGSWLVDEILSRGSATDAAFLESAIRRGDIVWHAMPYTTQSEIAGLAAFRAGLGRSLALDSRFGRRTRAAKLTDVPGHTRGIVGPLAEAGVSLLHIGTNPGCGVCALPDAFRWRDSTGREITVVYQTDYGKIYRPPSGDDAFLISVAGDNSGAHSPETVEALLDDLRRAYPDAEIVCGTLDDLAAALDRTSESLPVVTSEIGDTWIHGFASDPILTARYRECLRFAETLAPDVRQKFLREIEIVAEHTCGLNIKRWLRDDRHWSGSAMKRLASTHPASASAAHRADLNDNGFAMCVRSWDEQREYIDLAARTLPPQDRRELLRRLASLAPKRAVVAGSTATFPQLAIRTPHFSFRIDQERGCIRDLRAADGTRLFREALLFGGELFGPDDYADYHRNYLRLRVDWTLRDFGKPGMPHRKYSLVEGFQVVASELPETVGRRFLLRSRNPNIFARAWELELLLPDAAPEIRATLRIFGKDPSRMPHALWCSFYPAKAQGAVSFTKLGEPINPADVVKGGGRALHAIDGEIRLADGARVETLDAPLVAPGVRDLLWKRRNPLPRPGTPFHVNLYNNIWGTNFPQWFGEDIAYRFVISRSIPEQPRTWHVGLGIATDTTPLVRFGFITDSHYAPHLDWGMRHFGRVGNTRLKAASPTTCDRRRYGDSLEKMRRFVRHMNRLGVDFVVEGGDFKDQGRTQEESLAYLDAIESTFAEFDGPRYHVLGNHDHDNISKEEFLVHIVNAGQPVARAWYSFDCKGVRFIILDANYRSCGSTYCQGDFDWRDCFLPEEQVAFLREALATALGPCVPILHQQLDTPDGSCIANAAEIRRIIEESGKVKCVVQGHWHEGSFREIGGVAYYSAPASVFDSVGESDAHSLIEVFPSGGVRIKLFGYAAPLEPQ